MQYPEEKKNRFPIFQERLRELQGGMSNTVFADFLGMSRQTVGFYLNGNRIPDILGLEQIARKCNVSSDWLLGLSNSKNTSTEKQQIHQTTGLSERFIDYVIDKKEHDNSLISTLNEFLLPDELTPILLDMHSFPYYLEKLMDSLEKAKEEIEKENLNGNSGELYELVDFWDQEVGEKYSDVRYWRFETVDALTNMFDNIFNYDDIVKKSSEFFNACQTIMLRLEKDFEE